MAQDHAFPWLLSINPCLPPLSLHPLPLTTCHSTKPRPAARLLWGLDVLPQFSSFLPEREPSWGQPHYPRSSQPDTPRWTFVSSPIQPVDSEGKPAPVPPVTVHGCLWAPQCNGDVTLALGTLPLCMLPLHEGGRVGKLAERRDHSPTLCSWAVVEPELTPAICSSSHFSPSSGRSND